MSFSETIRQQAQGSGKTLVFPEGNDERVQEAAARLVDLGIVETAVLIGQDIKESDGIKTVDPGEKLPLDIAAEMLNSGEVDGMVAGAQHPTSDVLTTCIKSIGVKEEVSVVSSSFIIEFEDRAIGDNGHLVFSDPAVVPKPNAEQLAEVAEEAVSVYRNLLQGNEPKVAFLSFSTHGSADHEEVDKMQEAAKLFKQRNPDILAGGELQVDAALNPETNTRKAEESDIDGDANILIFPDLNAANIGYKLVHALAEAEAYGPFLQGVKRPVNDLSRGCSVDDIITVAAATVLEAADS